MGSFDASVNGNSEDRPGDVMFWLWYQHTSHGRGVGRVHSLTPIQQWWFYCRGQYDRAWFYQIEHRPNIRREF